MCREIDVMRRAGAEERESRDGVMAVVTAEESGRAAEASTERDDGDDS